jgi:hypothetical protein
MGESCLWGPDDGGWWLDMAKEDQIMGEEMGMGGMGGERSRVGDGKGKEITFFESESTSKLQTETAKGR